MTTIARRAYEIMTMIAHKQGVDRIRMFNREGSLMFSTDAREHAASRQSHKAVCDACHDQSPARTKPRDSSRVRYTTSPEGISTLNMITPIYNERACSDAACHAHPANFKVLGVLDLALRLDPVQQQEHAISMQVIGSTAGVVIVGAAFVILFTRRFVAGRSANSSRAPRRSARWNWTSRSRLSHSSEELDELARSFDVMRERFAKALAEINQFTQKLETKVEERTQQLKAAQQKLLQSDRLASLGQLSASVAHEINNPVSGVLNLSMLLQRMLKDDGIPPGARSRSSASTWAR